MARLAALTIPAAIHLFGGIGIAAAASFCLAGGLIFAATFCLAFFHIGALAILHITFVAAAGFHLTGHGIPVVLAAGMEFIVGRIAAFETGIVISGIGNLLLDLCGISGRTDIRNGDLFFVHIPAGFFGAGLFRRFFNGGFAHAAVTRYFEGFGNGLGK